MAAGLSLGEYCALVFAGALSFEDGLKVEPGGGILLSATCPAGCGAGPLVPGSERPGPSHQQFSPGHLRACPCCATDRSPLQQPAD